MTKATTTIRQSLQHQPHQAALFAATQALFNRVAAFYFEVIQAHEGVLDLSNKEALTALEKLTHTTQHNPHPVMPLEDEVSDIPAMFRRAAIHAALGSARSFFAHLKKWRAKKEKAQAKGKTFHERPPVPPYVEQVRHALRGPMEGSTDGKHPAQNLDGHMLELAQMSAHRAGSASRSRDGKSCSRAAWESLVVAYSGGEAVHQTRKDRKAS